jgi:DNA-binding transcriptional LysR family regulator
MPQTPGMDGFGEIGVFVRVVEARGFTRAGKSLGLTASGVSRILTRLEARLGARLLDRTTRSIGLTAEGAAYYALCTKILRELEDANLALAGGRAAPRGRLRVDTPTILGRFVIAPALPRFLAEHPALSVDLSLRDQLVDPIAEGLDVVVRMAELRDSDLVVQKVGSLRARLVASPAYLERRGRPVTPRDLGQHDQIAFLAGGGPISWRFRGEGQDTTLAPSGRLHSNSSDAIRAAVLAGMGVAQLFDILVHEEIAAGTVERLLRDHEPPPRAVYALSTRARAALPKVRVFLAFLTDLLRARGK